MGLIVIVSEHRENVLLSVNLKWCACTIVEEHDPENKPTCTFETVHCVNESYYTVRKAYLLH